MLSRWAASWSRPAAMIRSDSSRALPRMSWRMPSASARASSRMRAASVRASASWARYCSSSWLASACAASARLMPPSIASTRAANVFSICGKTNFISTKQSRPNAISAEDDLLPERDDRVVSALPALSGQKVRAWTPPYRGRCTRACRPR